ncbi:PKD domain-containing protein [Tamlana sp. 2_MG-2023]|uniref:PKD domain-containing protein n=1 Tax=unclassified Tamlana TaxID=2614803 RepID=UPI0026E45F11|nr:MULTISPECIES: PKD domain-containing protein [unclassified Tamlana]MDO6761535.1 PKD domain-containing protein [Tamlana sp. 2_MG-2023]MDO6792371.1 PKD domain-containing protein [Tamlana sp. 1_MG-2023]
MNKNSNETIIKYLDKNVIVLFLSVFLASGTVLAYRVFTDFPCEQIVIDVNARAYRVGELVKFTDLTEHSESWQWHFGDSSAVSNKREALHVYSKPGKYEVKLKVNNSCETTQTVIIKEKKFVLNPNKIPKLIVPDSITVGQKLILSDSTPGAYSWEWRFGETANANAITKTAEYTYTDFGLKTITLVVNGDVNHMAKQRIRVYAEAIEEQPLERIRPEQREIGWDIPYEPEVEKTEEKKKKEIPFISESDFEVELIKVSDEKITEKELEVYFCGNINKSIVVNGKNTTFLVFCQKIRGKNIRIKRITIFRNEGSNCIENINLEYNRKIL